MEYKKMEYKNRYQRAAHAFIWLRNNKKSYKEAMEHFGIQRKQLIGNVGTLYNKDPDLFKMVLDGKLSYETAYKRSRAVK
jgi:hypothetical protein